MAPGVEMSLPAPLSSELVFLSRLRTVPKPRRSGHLEPVARGCGRVAPPPSSPKPTCRSDDPAVVVDLRQPLVRANRRH